MQADLNGDGKTEVLLVTHSLEVHLISPVPASSSSPGFSRAVSKHREVLDLSSVLLGDKQPVALAAGYIDPPENDLVHTPRKMVIVIVTAGWLVICLDHNLKVLWEKSIHGHFPHHAAMREVRPYGLWCPAAMLEAWPRCLLATQGLLSTRGPSESARRSALTIACIPAQFAFVLARGRQEPPSSTDVTAAVRHSSTANVWQTAREQ